MGKAQDSRRILLNDQKIMNFSCIMFFISPLLTLCFKFILYKLDIFVYVKYFYVFLIYSLFIIALLMNPKKYLKLDIILFYVFILVFFALTYILNPEYEQFYKRVDYGVIDHVFFPTNGIFAYAFFRMVSNPDEQRRLIKYSGYIMIIYFVNMVRNYLIRGYWHGVAGTDPNAKFTYSVAFGYQVLFFLIFLVFDALENKKISDILLSLIGIVSVILLGSRGPTICILMMILFYILRKNIESKQKLLRIIYLILILSIIVLFFDNIINYLNSILLKYNLNSRFIDRIINNNFSEGSGREYIWSVTIQKIIDRPFGYGFMGSRSFLGNIIYAGYPHNFILEIISDYGVFFGSIIVIIFIKNYLFIVFNKNNMKHSKILVIMSGVIFGLMMSLTYWNVPSFWICLATFFNSKEYNRNAKY